MYSQYFGFREEPFADIADLRFFYPTPLYQKAYTTLLSGIREYKGFLLLTGEAGTGKTTILRRILRDLETPSHSLFFDSTSLTCTSIDDLLYFICAQLGMRDKGNSRVEKLRSFTAYLSTLASNGGTGVLVIDEAHHLSEDVLNGLRMIAPLDPKSERLLLQIVLVGQPELEVKLDQPKLRPIQQRIALRCELACFPDQEVSPYIHHRLAVVGCERRDLFSPEAIAQIAACAKGSPRLINIICDNALFLAHGKLQQTVSAAIVEEVVANLRLAPSRAYATLPEPTEQLPTPTNVSVNRQRADERILPLVLPWFPRLPGNVQTLLSILWLRFWRQLVALLFLALVLGLLVYGRRAPEFSQLTTRAPEARNSDLRRPGGTQEARRPPVIMGALPTGQTLAMQGGQTQRFTVEVKEAGEAEAVEVTWLLDGQRIAEGRTWLFTPLVTESDRRHTVTVTITDNKRRTIERQWTVAVARTVVLPLQITGVRPVGQELRVAEGQKVNFMVEMANAQPDLQYTWLLDGQEQARESTWTYEARRTNAEQQTVTVQVRGANRQVVERSWKISVRPVEHPPAITAALPANPTVTIGVGKRQSFTVEVHDPDSGDVLTTIWLLDGQEVARGRSWTFTPPRTDSGTQHIVTMTVSDRKGMTVERQWTVIVEKASQ